MEQQIYPKYIQDIIEKEVKKTISRRDYFAGMALQAFINSNSEQDGLWLCEQATHLADGLISMLDQVNND